MQLSGDFRVMNVKSTDYRGGIIRLEMSSESGISLALNIQGTSLVLILSREITLKLALVMRRTQTMPRIGMST